MTDVLASAIQTASPAAFYATLGSLVVLGSAVFAMVARRLLRDPLKTR